MADSTQIITTQFMLRRGYEEAWVRNNPVLAAGEPGFVIDKYRFKIGDGTKTWNELQYIDQLDQFNELSALFNKLFTEELVLDCGGAPKEGV